MSLSSIRTFCPTSLIPNSYMKLFVLSSTAVQETLGPKYGVTEYAIEESHRGIYPILQ